MISSVRFSFWLWTLFGSYNSLFDLLITVTSRRGFSIRTCHHARHFATHSQRYSPITADHPGQKYPPQRVTTWYFIRVGIVHRFYGEGIQDRPRGSLTFHGQASYSGGIDPHSSRRCIAHPSHKPQRGDHLRMIRGDTNDRICVEVSSTRDSSGECEQVVRGNASESIVYS